MRCVGVGHKGLHDRGRRRMARGSDSPVQPRRSEIAASARAGSVDGPCATPAPRRDLPPGNTAVTCCHTHHFIYNYAHVDGPHEAMSRGEVAEDYAAYESDRDDGEGNRDPGGRVPRARDRDVATDQRRRRRGRRLADRRRAERRRGPAPGFLRRGGSPGRGRHVRRPRGVLPSRDRPGRHRTATRTFEETNPPP